MAGQPVVGYFACFPGTPEPPRRFPEKQAALEYWPEVGFYIPVKQVFYVYWQPYMGEGWDSPDARWKNELVGCDITVLENPMSRESHEEQRKAKLAAAAAAKKAKGKSKNVGADGKDYGETLQHMDAILGAGEKRREVAKARRRSYKK
jgi:hypothetical protein